MVCGALILKYFPAKRADFKRREIKATTILTSFASDFDLIADWTFYAQIAGKDKYDAALVNTLLVFCILGTFMWLMLITEGRIFKRCLRKLKMNISTGYMILASVIVEDLPQVILTFLIEDELSVYAVVNVITALYDILIKLAEAYEDRNDYIKVTENRMFEDHMEMRNNILSQLEKGEIPEDKQAKAYLDLGEKEKELGQFAEAKTHFMKALTIQEKTLKPENIEFGTTYAWLGLVEMNMGNYQEAKTYFLKTLAIKEKFLPSDHPNLATSYNNLGSVEKNMGNYQEAKTYYLKALAIKEKSLPSDHVDLATSYNNLGVVEKNMGNYQEAKTYYLKSLAIREKSLPSDHPNLATSYWNIGLLCANNLNEKENAKEYFTKAKTIYEKKGMTSDVADCETELNEL